LQGTAFVVRRPHPVTGEPVRWVTPLFLALFLVEGLDLVFAVDSVPAIFAITTNPFIVFTSNLFAILGLRALYFALSALLHRFVYLKHALALVLIFIGLKIGLHHWLVLPTALSLAVTLGLVGGGIGFSLWKTRGPLSSPVAQPPSSPA
jgi:tellurite resistance protein TerC